MNIYFDLKAFLVISLSIMTGLTVTGCDTVEQDSDSIADQLDIRLELEPLVMTTDTTFANPGFYTFTVAPRVNQINNDRERLPDMNEEFIILE